MVRRVLTLGKSIICQPMDGEVFQRADLQGDTGPSVFQCVCATERTVFNQCLAILTTYRKWCGSVFQICLLVFHLSYYFHVAERLLLCQKSCPCLKAGKKKKKEGGNSLCQLYLFSFMRKSKAFPEIQTEFPLSYLPDLLNC